MNTTEFQRRAAALMRDDAKVWAFFHRHSEDWINRYRLFSRCRTCPLAQFFEEELGVPVKVNGERVWPHKQMHDAVELTPKFRRIAQAADGHYKTLETGADFLGYLARQSNG